MKIKAPYKIRYVPKEKIAPAFGLIDTETNHLTGDSVPVAIIRDDLAPKVKIFVRAHELYHLRDKYTWGGWIFRELRANVIPGLKDPIGFFSTFWATVRDRERLKFYLDRFVSWR